MMDYCQVTERVAIKTIGDPQAFFDKFGNNFDVLKV
jgi:hypothetical protein